MTTPPLLEVASLSRFYSQMRQPFAPLESNVPSVSILRKRSAAVIPEPTLQYGAGNRKTAVEFAYSEIAVAYLPDAIVTRTGAVIFQDKYVIEETLEGSLEANGLGGNLSPEQLRDCPRSSEVIINCNKLGMWNYSLFLFEVAPTIMLSSFLPGLEQVRVRLFFQQFMRAEDINNRLAVFKLFGVERDRMLIADADLYRHKGVIIFKINDAHRSQRLSRMVSPVCAAIREEYASSQITTPRKVYISRQRASARAVSNYDELKRSILERRGFVPVELESLTLAQQVDMFAKADVVLAEHGAGLANIAFMRPGAYVIEAFPEPIASRAVYRYLAAHCRLNYLCCSFATQAGWRWDQDNVEVPIDAYEYLASKV